MSMTVEALIALRNQTLDEYVDGRTSEGAYRADLGAIAVELDRVVSPAGEGRLGGSRGAGGGRDTCRQSGSSC